MYKSPEIKLLFKNLEYDCDDDFSIKMFEAPLSMGPCIDPPC